MKLRTYLGLAAVLVATAIPAIGSAQRTRSRTNYGGYGRGPFYPSRIPGPSQRWVGAGAPLRVGGARVYFGPGGGTYGYTPYGYNPFGYNPYGYGYYGSPYGGYYGGTTYYYGNRDWDGGRGNRYRPGGRLYRRNR